MGDLDNCVASDALPIGEHGGKHQGGQPGCCRQQNAVGGIGAEFRCPGLMPALDGVSQQNHARNQKSQHHR